MSEQPDNAPTNFSLPAGQSDEFRIFAETAADAILVIDRASIILFANHAAGRIFGHTLAEMLGQELTLLMPDYLRHAHRAGVERYLSDGQKHISWQSVELPGLHKSGRIIPLEISFGQFVKDGAHYFTGIARDITDRKRAEQRLAAQYAVTTVLAEAPTLAEATPVVLRAICEQLDWALGALWTIERGAEHLRLVETWHAPTINVSEFEAHSYKQTLPVGVGLPGRVCAEGAAIWIADITTHGNFPRAPAAARAGLHGAFGFPIRLGSEVLGVLEFFSPEVREPDPDLLRMMTTIGSQLGQFIERKRAEDELRKAEQRAITEYEQLLAKLAALAQALGAARDLSTIYRALRDFAISSVPCAGILISLYDTERDARTAAYGWGDGREWDVTGLSPMPITPTGPNSRAVRTGEVVITDDYMKAVDSQLRIVVGRDDGLHPQSSLAAPMSVMGRIVGTVEVQSYEHAAYGEEHATAVRMAANLAAAAIENTQLLAHESKARAQAETANRLKDDFLATVSHELRTPMTAVIGWTHLLRAGQIAPADTARALEIVERNAQAQVQLIDDLLDVSRIVTGKLRVNLSPTMLVPVVEAALNVVLPAAEAKGVSIERSFEPTDMLISGDAARLQQMIWNLFSNAIKFTPAGGRVVVKLVRRTAHIALSISDNGMGIPAEFLPHVFDRFRQADASITRQHGGLGLGLAIVRHLVELHGGTVAAESAGAGQGATFVVTLPTMLAPARPLPAAPG